MLVQATKMKRRRQKNLDFAKNCGWIQSSVYAQLWLLCYGKNLWCDREKNVPISFSFYSFVVYTCYYGLVGNTANIGNENIFLPYIYGATMEMAVVFSIPFLLNKMGRRWTLITMLLAATVSSFVFVFSPSGN